MTSKRYPPLPILIIDDEKVILKSFEIALKSAGFRNLITCGEPERVAEILARERIYTILLDLNMPRVSGQQLLAHITTEHPDIPTIVITGNNEVQTAVQCMKQGAFDYMVKPVEKSRLVSGVRRAVEIRELQYENYLLKQRILDSNLRTPEAFSDIVTNNSGMLAIFQYAESIATSPQPLLISGETGVGKELMAKAVHRLSGRNGECVFVNVAGIDDNAFADTLFGHLRGAFTGADQSRAGLVEKAAGGTLVLDEIGDLGRESQVKLLRLIQEGEYYPLGSDTARASDTRIIVCTNVDLDKAQQEGLFRKDLYYRLRSHRIELPPLRHRADDIPLLLEHLVAEAAQEQQKSQPTFPPELLDLLGQYHFPGNIRELQSMVYDAVSISRGRVLALETFHRHLEFGRQKEPGVGSDEGRQSHASLQLNGPLPTLKEANQFLIQEALRRTRDNQSMAARMLGISRQTLARQLNAAK